MKQSLPKRLGNLYESCISYFWTIDPFFVHIVPHLRGAMTSIDIWGDRYCNVHVCACFVSCVFFWPLVIIFSTYIIFFKEDKYLIEKALPHCQNLHYTKFAIHIVRKFMPLLTIAFFFHWCCLISMQLHAIFMLSIINYIYNVKNCPQNYKDTDWVFTFDLFFKFIGLG